MVKAMDAACAALHPTRFGLTAHGTGWVRTFPGLGDVVFTPLNWQHAQLRGTMPGPAGEPVELDALELVVELQRETWGMAPEELVPANILGMLTESAGTMLVAFQRDRGFTYDGWLGFAIGLGSATPTMLSHMLGVRADARGRHDIGWYLKVLQAYDAVGAGYRRMEWTFDPLRGANARLNLEKLGAIVRVFTVDKYGTLRSSLYGEVPSDRFTAEWELDQPAMWERVAAIADGSYQPLTLADVADLPVATLANLEACVAARPPALTYEIPGDIDALMLADPAAAIAWRQAMQRVLPALVTTKRAALAPNAGNDPTRVGIATSHGHYEIDGIATGFDDAGVRRSRYRLRRRAHDQRSTA